VNFARLGATFVNPDGVVLVDICIPIRRSPISAGYFTAGH
jgi:hypothetical protein